MKQQVAAQAITSHLKGFSTFLLSYFLLLTLKFDFNQQDISTVTGITNEEISWKFASILPTTTNIGKIKYERVNK